MPMPAPVTKATRFFRQGEKAKSDTVTPWPALLRAPFAAEHFGRRPGHVDMLIGSRPLEPQVAAGQMGQNGAGGTLGDHAGDANSAGAGAARQRDAAAALPGPHGDFA